MPPRPPVECGRLPPVVRRLLTVPAYVLRAVALVVLVAAGLFVALTRTEVGRDGLRRQVERSFNEAYRGELRIGRLSGNLVADLYATDVRLYDPDGGLVLTVDSAALRPTWRSLLARTVEVRAATLVRPRLTPHRRADGAWNLARALAPRRARTSPQNAER